MRENKIQIHPFEVLAVLDCKSVQEPNEHGWVEITALISSEKREEYQTKARRTTWVEVMVGDDTGEEKQFFCGVLVSMSMKVDLHECIMELKLLSGTIFLEREVHLRSFQSESLTFRSIIDICNGEYEDASVIMTVGKGEKLPHFILQYYVDDWKFLRRMCALNGSVLVPSHMGKGIKYFFGIPQLKENVVFDTDSYTVINGKIISYAIEDREIYSIGTKAEFMGDSFFIWKIESKLKGGELYHTYYIAKDITNLIEAQNLYDTEMTGASLYGEVVDVNDEQVKISIDADENQKNTGDRWFPFSTVYSSSDGAGWYCMPEIGDRIRLYLPSEKEESSYVCSAVHEKKGEGIRTNPDNKIWRNKYGKEIRLTPDSILLTNNKGNSIKLSDESGIRIKSSGSVRIQADGRIQISSENAGIEVAASSRIRLQQGDTELLLKDGVQVTGAKINIM